MYPTIEQLKVLTLQAQANFSEAATYFLEHMAENLTFLQVGSLLTGAKAHFYTHLLTSVLERFPSPEKVKQLVLRRLRKERFVHGAGILPQGKHLVFYFFEEAQAGLAIIFSLDGAMDFFRLTLVHTDSWLLPAVPASSALH